MSPTLLINEWGSSVSKNYVIEIPEGDSLEIRRYSSVPGIPNWRVRIYEKGNQEQWVRLPMTADVPAVSPYLVGDWDVQRGGYPIVKIEPEENKQQVRVLVKAIFPSLADAYDFATEMNSK